MYGVCEIWLIIVNLLLYSKCADEIKAIAKFPLLKEQNKALDLKFFENFQDPFQVKLKPSHLISFEWRIHMLPVQMGLDSCSQTTIGDCFKCHRTASDRKQSNQPGQPVLQCLSGKFDSNAQITNDLPSCAKMSGQNGLIGRSVVVIVEDKRTSTRSETVYCATIFKEEADYDQFTSTIAWFQKPYAGFIAFRKRSGFQSYIIVNMTRVTTWELKSEKLQWRIEEDKDDDSTSECTFNPKSGKYNCLFNPKGRKLHSDEYSTECMDSSQYGCAQGDLTKKHNLLELYNSKTNLLLFVDASLYVTWLLHNRLVLYRLLNDNSREVVASAVIEDIQPLLVTIPFMDGSSLKLVQRDPWSLVMHKYERMNPEAEENIQWTFTIHKVPTVHICSGELWNCNYMWSNLPVEPDNDFKAMSHQSPLGQRYTLYGRNSIMYHGVIIKNKNRPIVKNLCSTITYKQEEELVGYSKLENSIDQAGQRAVVIVIQHATLRQTTFLIASKCKEYSMPLYLSLSNNSCRSSDVYNPYNVCPALCSERSCGNSCGKHCCTNCAPHSSSLCPMGDLRSRFGTFLQHTTPFRPGTKPWDEKLVWDEDLVFTVMNDLDLPLADMIDKKLGLKIAQSFDPDELVRCGSVRRLRQTQVKVQLAGGAELTLSQNATWQPLTISWTHQLVSNISLTFWETPGFDKSVCKHTPVELDTYTESDLPFPPATTRRSFFGPKSVLGCSLSVEYTGVSGVETTTVDLLPKGANELTYNVQAILKGEDGTEQLEFDLMQRVDHLTEETYIKVTILDSTLCNSHIVYKWYIIKNTTVIRRGDKFEVTNEKDKRFFGSEQADCAYGSLKPGDLSGKLGDLKLDGAGQHYRDAYIPVKSVVGHYLLLTHQNNTVVASLTLRNAPKTEGQGPIISAPQQSNVYIIVVVAVAVIVVVIVIFLCCCLYIHKRNTCCGLKASQPPTPRGYDPVGQMPKAVEPQYPGFYKIRRPNGEMWGPVQVVGCENKYILLLKVQHMHTTEIEKASADMLIEIPKDELEIQADGYIKTRASQIQTAGCIVTNGAQGYPREPRVIIKKPFAEENLYSKLPTTNGMSEPSYTDYNTNRYRRTTQSTRSDSSLSGASVSS